MYSGGLCGSVCVITTDELDFFGRLYTYYGLRIYDMHCVSESFCVFEQRLSEPSASVTAFKGA